MQSYTHRKNENIVFQKRKAHTAWYAPVTPSRSQALTVRTDEPLTADIVTNNVAQARALKDTDKALRDMLLRCRQGRWLSTALPSWAAALQ